MKNKKQLIALLFVALLVCCVAVTLVACNGFGGTSNNQTDTGDNGNGKIDSGTTDKNAMITDIQGGTVDGLTLYLEVDTTISMVDLSGMITTSKDSSWQLYEDVLGQKLIPTKYAAPLFDGNNTYYIVVNSSDGTINRTYTLVIYKNYYATISYILKGELYDTQKVLTHTTLKDFRHPQINGYNFEGWDCEGHYVVADKSFYAKIKAIKYDIKYNLNGGTNNSNNPSTYTIESSTITLETPSRNGYTFEGWYSDRGLTNKVTTIETGSYGDKTLYAKWTPIIYTISYNLDGGSVSGTNPTSFTIESDDITLINPTKFGYTFLGWNGTGIEGKSSSVKIAKCSYGNRNYTANWQAVEEMSNFEFTSTATTCTITGIKDKTVKSIVVPDYVTNIDKGAFSGCSSLQSITLPFVGGSKTAISASSSTLFGYIFGTSSYTGGTATTQYYSSSEYTTYYIPSTLKSVTITGGNILYGAFYGCSGLTSITIGNGVTSIGNYAFSGCSGLTKVNWNATNCTTAGSSSSPIFMDCTKLATINIGDEVKKIPNYAFYNCSGLTSITIPDSVTSIGGWAFRICSGLTSITIPNSVTSIGDRAFEYCSGLTSVTIGNGVTSIGENAFYECYKLVEVWNKSSLTITKGSTNNGYVGYYALNVYTEEGGSKLTTDENGFVIYDGTTLVSYVGNATDITIPNTIKTINKYAFYGCSNLTSITIPSSVTSIGDHAFYNCSGLTSITIPNSVTSIGEWTFYNCSGLTSITIGNSVTSIGDYAFYRCGDLTSITIPDSVTSIGNYAFYGCSGLTSVTIGNSVTSIGWFAFYGCSGLTSVTIGNSVTSIGGEAFRGCSKLTSITFADTTTWYRTDNSTNWRNKTGGTETDVTNASTNATNFKSTYYDSYWYKL